MLRASFKMINFSEKFDERQTNNIPRKTTFDFKLSDDFTFDNCHKVPQGWQI